MQTLEEKLKSVQKFDLTGFEIEKTLGSGSFGTTYLARRGLEKVVIKEFNKATDREDSHILIEREIRNLSFFTDSRLIIGFKGISFYDINHEFQDYPLLILEYAENGSLEDFLMNNGDDKTKQFNDAEKMIILYGIAKAMQYLHNFNIVHRDLKPANILLDKNYYPLLSDFGSSRAIDQYSSKEITPTLGTPIYTAPEVFDNFKEEISMKSDVYSYSMIMYHLLTGIMPYSNMKNPTIFRIIKHVKEEKRVDIPDFIPSYFNYLIKLTWHQNPNERPDFTDIIRLFDSGIILKTIIQDEELLEKYFEYTQFVSNFGSYDKSKLVQLQSRLHNNENKVSLSYVITFFLADVFNDSESQTKIGNHYMTGVILERNYNLGYKYLQMAAIQNNDEALFFLGNACNEGCGCKKDSIKADEYIQRSAKYGNKKALNYNMLKNKVAKVDWNRKRTAIIVGSVNTGKTTFINYLINNYTSAIMNQSVSVQASRLCLKDVKNGSDFYANILDIPGMDNNFMSLTPQICRMVDLAIVMFDVSNIETFNSIDGWIGKLREYVDGASFLIIGNKIDLDRSVPFSDIQDKVSSFGPDTKYVEISALKRINIDQAIRKIIKCLKKSSRNNFFDESIKTNLDDNLNTNKKCC